MPNWCHNRVRVHGEAGELRRLTSHVRGVDHESKPLAFSLEKIQPTPPALLKGDAWHDWRLEHWGTKWETWNVSATHAQDDCFEVEFCTAYVPPLAALRTLSGEFPDLTIEVVYSEPNCEIAGKCVLRRGRVTRSQDKGEHYEAVEFLRREWPSQVETWSY